MKKAFFCLSLLAFINLFVCLKANVQAQTQDKEFFFKSDTLIKISLHYIKLKDYKTAEKTLKAAYKTAKKIKEPYSREIIFNEIVDKYILMGENENAFRVALFLEFSDVQSEAFAKITYKCAELANFALAAETIKQIKDPFSKARTFYRIVNKLTDLELYEEATKFAAETEKSSILIGEFIAVEFLENRLQKQNGDSAAGQYLIEPGSPDELYRRSKELAEISERYSDLYLFGLAKKILFRAARVAKQISLESLKQDALYRIEIARNRMDKRKKSLNIADDKN